MHMLKFHADYTRYRKSNERDYGKYMQPTGVQDNSFIIYIVIIVKILTLRGHSLSIIEIVPGVGASNMTTINPNR